MVRNFASKRAAAVVNSQQSAVGQVTSPAPQGAVHGLTLSALQALIAVAITPNSHEKTHDSHFYLPVEINYCIPMRSSMPTP